MTSPLPDDRLTKRPKTSSNSNAEHMAQIPDHIADVVADGDALIVVTSMQYAGERQIGFRVSSQALGMTSPVFKSLLSETGSMAMEDSSKRSRPTKILSLPEDSGDAICILLHLLHLRNDKLPVHVAPPLLCALATLVHKYECVIAAGRATLQWFDRLYASKDPGDVWKIIEAAYLLDEPMFFARFTSRWVVEAPLHRREMPVAGTAETQKLSLMLSDRLTQAMLLLRKDLDTLASSCISAFSKQNRHYIDYAPTIHPDSDEGAPTECHVDPQGAVLYLGALHDADIFPSTTWEQPRSPLSGSKGETIGSLVDKLASFREPEYTMQDRCEFCDDIKIKFTEKLESVREVQKERLWGLCLDCYKVGGVKMTECSFEHAKVPLATKVPMLDQLSPAQMEVLKNQMQEALKAQVQSQQTQAQQGQTSSNGLGIDGL